MNFLQDQINNRDLDKRVKYSQLGDKIFKARAMNPAKLWGLASASLSGYIWWYFPYIVASYGFNTTAFLGTASILYSMSAFSTPPFIKSIKVDAETGNLKIEVGKSAFFASQITCQAGALQKLSAMPEEEGDVTCVVVEHVNAEGKKVEEPLVLAMPGDAIKDTEYVDFLLEQKTENSTTDADFFGLMEARAMRVRAMGAVPDMQKRLVLGSQYGAVGSDRLISEIIETDDKIVDE